MTALPWQRQSDSLHQRVRRFIEGALGRPAEELLRERDALALDIARYQADQVEALGPLWENRDENATSSITIDAIPAAPCDLFRLRRVAAHPAEMDERCFRTSGTTAGAEARGEHPMRTTATYTCAALTWAKPMLWPDREALQFIGLTEPEQDRADSSLLFMLSRFSEQLDEQPSWHAISDGLDVDGVARSCSLAREQGQAALVAGPSLAFAELCDELDPGSLVLPAGSRIMHTGGFKGRAREVEPGALRERIASLFRLPPSHVVGEYGMTELSSQLYEGSLCRALGLGCEAARPGCYYPPPWLRVRAVDPETLRPTPREEEGLAEVMDLANVDSALVILTSDRVRERQDGSIELLGRSPGAPPRGCSLVV